MSIPETLAAVWRLLNTYPFLLNYLLDRSPAFSRLKNPFLRKSVAKFWLELGERFIHIHYFPVRRQGRYAGCLEVSQDVTDIRALTGQQCLLEWN
jgi:hypothetical protein